VSTGHPWPTPSDVPLKTHQAAAAAVAVAATSAAGVSAVKASVAAYQSNMQHLLNEQRTQYQQHLEQVLKVMRWCHVH